MLLTLLQQNPLAFVIVALPLLYALVLHELAHAWVADRVGDHTARNLGRITLNPLKHLDPVGTLMLLVAGFGWARPVPIRPGNFRRYRLGLFLVSIAGVVVNLLLAVLALLILGALGVRSNDAGLFVALAGSPAQDLAQNPLGQALLAGLDTTVRINLVLVVFNLLPVPPLDGAKVLQAFAPQAWQRALWQLERYGFVLVIVILFGFRAQVTGLINTVSRLLTRLILG